jgi:hypothetical protein
VDAGSREQPATAIAATSIDNLSFITFPLVDELTGWNSARA